MIDKCDMGIIGLAVMGRNLALNINERGFSVAVYSKTAAEITDFVDCGGAAYGKSGITIAYTPKDLCDRLQTPRKILLMIKAGDPVDEMIECLLPYLDSGDCIIDGGNSFFKDTIRRYEYLYDKGIIYCGTGISGGEEGARHGPSIMPGGDVRAWPLVKDIFQSISAKTATGIPCCEWIGGDGAGHYVKMVHNGIEYGDMQLICEAYSMMKNALDMKHDEMSELFEEWNKTELESYLIGITADILRYKDEDGEPLVEKISDSAEQKGTGKWMSMNSLELGVPITLVTEAVYARMLSAMVDERRKAALILNRTSSTDKTITAEDIKHALLASKIISYAQGFMLLASASKKYSWNIDLGGIALLWRNGCIIRSVFLDAIKNAYHKNPSLQNLLLDNYFGGIIAACQSSWRKVVSTAVMSGIAVPAFSSALTFYDGYGCEKSSANLLQAQRDYFGAHRYGRVDKPRGENFHTNWTNIDESTLLGGNS